LCAVGLSLEQSGPLGYGELRTLQPDTVRIIEIANSLASPTNQRAGKNVDEPSFPAPVGREGQSRSWDSSLSRAISPLDGRCGQR
jgi:hypothetical protein